MCRLLRHHGLGSAAAILTLGAYLIAAFGLLPAPATLARWLGSAITDPFPCQDHSCGCATAHECWTQCCCFSDEQRLAWALQRGIQPPAGVTISEAQWQDAVALTKFGSCCSEPFDSFSSTSCPERSNERLRVVSPLSCKGVPTMLAIVPPPVLPTRSLSLILPEPGHHEPTLFDALVLRSRSLDIPYPPPRA